MLNQAGMNLIKTFEGCELIVYKDVGGVPTVGYGHVTNLPVGYGITQEQADAWLIEDLTHAENAVLAQISRPLSSNQFAACVSLCFNIGAGNFKDSSVRKWCNAGRFDLAANWFAPWCKVHGVEVEGLLNRRLAEAELFRTPDGQES